MPENIKNRPENLAPPTGDKKLNEVIRVQKRQNNFVMIDKGFLENPDLSWKSKGILAYLLSKPDDWKVIVGDLVKRAADGKTAVYNGLSELKKHGYYEKTPVRSGDGRRIDHWESTVYELPQATKPENTPSRLLPGYQEIDDQEIENQFIENRERNNNYNTNKNNYNNNQVSQVNADGRDKKYTVYKKIDFYTEFIKNRIRYSDFVRCKPLDVKFVDECIAVIIDVLMTEIGDVQIDGEMKPRELVKSVFTKFEHDDIELVVEQYKKVSGRITKKKAYILTMLYNSKLEKIAHWTNVDNVNICE